MMSSPQPMQSYYAARAGEYDDVYRKPERQADLRAIEAWLPGLFDGRTVIEIACGTGYWTRFIATQAARIVGLDAAAETLAIARTRVMPDKVELVVGDAYALPTQPGAFDAAFAGFWFSHVPIDRRDEFLAGIGRAVRPGSPVVLIDNRFVDGSSTPVSETDAGGNTWQLRRLADGSTHRVMKNFPTPGELATATAGHGSNGVFRDWHHFWSFEYTATGH